MAVDGSRGSVGSGGGHGRGDRPSVGGGHVVVVVVLLLLMLDGVRAPRGPPHLSGDERGGDEHEQRWHEHVESVGSHQSVVTYVLRIASAKQSAICWINTQRQ